MSEIQDDPFAVTFGRFRAEIDEAVSPVGVTVTRTEVRRRRRLRGVAAGIAAAIAIAVPVTVFAAAGDHASVVPGGSPSPSGPSSPSSSPGRPDRTAVTPITGSLTWIARTGPDGGRMNASVIRLVGAQISEAQILSDVDVVTIALGPDGRRMAFQGNGQGGGLNVADLDGQNLLNIDNTIDPACGAPAWSPTSNLIVYGRGVAATKIAVINPDGTGRRIVGTGCHPAFSVDGSQIAYVDNAGGLDVVNVDGTGHRVVTGKLGPAGIQTITSVDHDGGHAIVDLGTGPCCDSGDVRHLRLIDPRVVDLATGTVSRLPGVYGAVVAAFYVKSGGMVLRVTMAADEPGKIVFLSPGGTETAVFDESQLSLPGYPVTSLNVDLVGAQP